MIDVSVVITAFNEEQFLDAAIDSVLCQDAPPDEIIVVNDASSDGTQTVIDAYVATHSALIRSIALSPNQGVPSARNAGAAAARGGLLAFLDGDDIWVPHKLSVQRAILDARPDADYTYGSAIELRESQLSASAERLGSPTGLYRPPDLCVGYLRDTYWNFWPSGPVYSPSSLSGIRWIHQGPGRVAALGRLFLRLRARIEREWIRRRGRAQQLPRSPRVLLV
jgi:glycosyltransferase involved in cell wall biosynthesis